MPEPTRTVSPVARVALYVATFTTGLFTGLLWCFMVAIDRAEEHLDARQYAFWRQVLITDLDRGIWPVLVLSALAPLVALVALWRRRRSPLFVWTLVAFVVYALFVMVYTVVLNVPLNNAVLGWDPSAPPADWTAVRDRWDLLNTIRTPLAFLSFFAYLRALVLMGRTDARAAVVAP